MLDFDMARPRYGIARILAVFRVVGLRARWYSLFRTQRGWHMEIGINAALPPCGTVALQAILARPPKKYETGADLRREAMNLRRAISLERAPSKFWAKRWNILFAEKL